METTGVRNFKNHEGFDKMKNDSLEDIIIGLKNAYKTGTYGSIQSGVYVKEILYEFEEVKLFDNKAAVMLPIVFTDMPERAAKIKYPSKNRPQIIKTNHDGSINFCFSMLEHQMSEEEIAPMADSIKDVMKKLQPATTFYTENVEKTRTNTFAWFTYQNHCMDGKIFNHMFVTAVDGKMVQGMFNCPSREMELWKYVMKDMMLTFRDITK